MTDKREGRHLVSSSADGPQHHGQLPKTAVKSMHHMYSIYPICCLLLEFPPYLP